MPPDGADQRAGDDQRRVVEHEPGHRDGGSGEGVEQRDDHRHVGAADRQHHQHAEAQRGDDHARAAPELAVARRCTQTPPPTAADGENARCSARPPGKVIGRAEDVPCSLPPATSEPENVTPPMMRSSDVVSVVRR